jgi:hypothetical protein
MPVRRVGMERLNGTVYGAKAPTLRRIATLRNARPKGQRGIARRAKALDSGLRK